MPPILTIDEATKRLDDLKRLYFEGEGGDFDPWTPDALFAERLGAPSVSQAAPEMMELPDQDTFLYRFLTEMIGQSGKPFHPQFQKFGTCVGQSAKLVADISMAFEAMMYGTAFPGRASVATMYTGGRVEIAKQPAAWEGSNCAWSIAFMEKFGIGLLKDVTLGEDSLDEDENLAMKWTRDRSGIPQKYEDLCKVRAVSQIVRPKDAREVGKAIQAGVVFFHGSQIIPSGTVDAKGFSPGKRSRGGHAVCWSAVRYNPFGLLYTNSWGMLWGRTEEHSEGAGAYPADQPLGSVWLNESESNAIISEGDTFGAVNIRGLAPRSKALHRKMRALVG